MQQHSKHISEFNSNQILQIINWGNEKLNLPAKVLEQESTKIITERVIDKDYLIGADVNGKIVKP